MKTIILLILSAFTAFAATTYPVLTDNPLRTFSGGGTNLALLNGTNVFTGTNTFAGAVVSTQLVRILFTASGFSAAISNAALSVVTNAGAFSEVTQLVEITVPAALSASSSYGLTYALAKTNDTANPVRPVVLVGQNTNFLTSVNALSAGSSRTHSHSGASLMSNAGTFTNQIASLTGGTATYTVNPPMQQLVDTSAPFKFYVGLHSESGSSTNIFWMVKLTEYP